MKTKTIFRLVFFWLLFLVYFIPQTVYGQFSNITITNIDPSPPFSREREGTTYLTPLYRKVLQTKDGVIFLQNSVSIVVGNGEEWLEFYTDEVDIIKDISLNSQGELYALVDNNVGKFVQNGNGYGFVPIFEDPIDDVFRSFSIFNDSIYIVGEKRIYQVDNRSLKTIKSTSSSNFLIGAKTRLVGVDPNKGLYDLNEGLSIIDFDETDKVTEVLPIGEDFITAGEQPGLYYWNTKNRQRHVLNESLTGITSLTHFGKAWIAVGTKNDGLYLLSQDGEILKHLNKENGRPSNHVNNSFEDKQKGLWVTTDNGVVRIDYLNAITQLFDGTRYGVILSIKWFGDNLYFGSTEGLFISNDFDFEKIADINGYVYALKTIDNNERILAIGVDVKAVWL